MSNILEGDEKFIRQNVFLGPKVKRIWLRKKEKKRQINNINPTKKLENSKFSYIIPNSWQ